MFYAGLIGFEGLGDCFRIRVWDFIGVSSCMDFRLQELNWLGFERFTVNSLTSKVLSCQLSSQASMASICGKAFGKSVL